MCCQHREVQLLFVLLVVLYSLLSDSHCVARGLHFVDAKKVKECVVLSERMFPTLEDSRSHTVVVGMKDMIVSAAENQPLPSLRLFALYVQ